MRWRRETNIIFLLATILINPSVYAEDIKNPNDCDVCPGEIHYGVDETRKILGMEGMKLVSNMKRFERKTIKIDLGGVLKDGSEENNDWGYELKIYGSQDRIYIEDIEDGSFILIETDYLNTHQSGEFDNWCPEIYLQSRKAEKIDLDDSVRLAWDKFERSNIYRWVLSDMGNISWTGQLRKRILQAIKLMAE